MAWAHPVLGVGAGNFERFYPGFSVITGETGAGKSIIIGAIGLLLGNRADTKMVKRGRDKCIVEATFDLSVYHSDVLKDFFERNDLDYEPEECLLRRSVQPPGKVRVPKQIQAG